MIDKKNSFIIRLIGRLGKFKIYLVDDEAIRNKAEYAEEFSDYGVNIGKKGLSTLNFSFIPGDEIWIAKSIKPNERHFIINNALAYIKGIERGLEPDVSYDNAIKHEQTMRANDLRNKLHIKTKEPPANPSHKNISPKVYIKKYGVINDVNDTVDIYSIKGEIVRDLYKTDYVEGGHGYVYEWIPLNEIWIDIDVPADEIPVVLLHEFTERTLMKYRKFPYVRAHVAASKVEFEHRGIFNKKDALKLSRHIVVSKLLKDIKY